MDDQAIVWISQRWVPHCTLWTNFKQEFLKQFQGKCSRMVISIVAGFNHKCLHADISSYYNVVLNFNVDGDMAAHSNRYHYRGFPRFGRVG